MLKLMIQSEIEDEQQYRRNHLANDCCISSTSYPHFRYWSKTVDHDRIQNDIDNCTNDLTDGRIKRASGCLKQFFKQ